MKIARRTEVSLKSLWAVEPDFSNWLASEPGLALINDYIGIAIENPTRECRPGNFPCDIQGKMVGDENHVVVIENQYGSTNHDHLGKILTHVAVHQALTGIWIAEKVAADHRTVVDWLNANTPDTVSLYLAEVRAYRIEDSPVALELNIVCRPNFQVKPRRNDISQGEQDRREWRRAFWTDIHEAIRSAGAPFRLQRPGPDHWSNVAIGRSGFSIAMLLTPSKRTVGVELTIGVKGWKQDAFDSLYAQKQAIEDELGVELEWMSMENKQSSRILWETELDPDEEAQREAVISWFAMATPRLYKAFKSRVGGLRPIKAMEIEAL